MKMLEEDVPAEGKYDSKAARIDNDLVYAGVVNEKIDDGTCRIPIHIPDKPQMEKIVFSILKDFKIGCHASNPCSPYPIQ